LALIGAVGLVAAMLKSEWTRLVAILSGAELATARSSEPRVRIRTRAWSRTAPRRSAPPRAAAA
jgi:hypothetical protein